MDCASEMAHTMKSFAQVCADPRRHEKMKRTLIGCQNGAINIHTQQIATLLDSNVQKVTPCYCMCVIAVVNFVVFIDDYCVSVINETGEKIESFFNE